MKPVFFLVILFISVSTFNQAFSQAKKPKSAKPTAAELEEGKTLLSKSDCLGCHKVDVKLVGPAYKDVAKKYPATEANYTLLANKVIKGGSGSWGQIPMSAHPQLTLPDVKKMIKYILAQK